MRRKYSDCQREDGDCAACPLVSCGMDCHNNALTKLEFARRAAGFTQKQLADASGVNIRQIQRVESGRSTEGNVTAKNLLAIADALGVDPHILLEG